MKILLTGATTYVGRHVLKTLLEAGHDIRLFAGDVPEGFGDGLTVVGGDLLTGEGMEAAIDGVEKVVYLSTQREPDRKKTRDVNTQGLMYLLKALGKVRFQGHFILGSSAAVYGDMVVMPQREDHIGHPLDFYSADVQKVEQYVDMYFRLHSIRYLTLRFFDVYGTSYHKGESPSIVLRLLQQAVKGQPMTLFGDGEFLRDFVHVDDICLAVDRALKCTKIGAVNVGTGTAISLNMLAKTVQDVTGKAVEITYLPENRQRMPHAIADTARAKEWLGFEPQVSLEKGIAKLKEAL
ncbi:MAG: NAD-dependent epimerase/dehydratase family protein [Proteobacteria bacterium]|nr:NAD-dependent epimerase/dehydratase family protein [Pseudomonadota bacterium]